MPELTAGRIDEIRRIMSENPEMTRTQLSERICDAWRWESPTGTQKTISCRRMLRKLDAAGEISLPAPLTTGRRRGASKPPPHIEHDVSQIECVLGDLTPLSVEIASGGARLAEFKSLIDQFHYLQYGMLIGENMNYIVRSASGATLACLQFGSAAWSCRDRDRHIGWGKERRAEALHYLSNNSRFIIPGWIHVPCLASHVLSLVAKRISQDWEAKYGHPLFALETFVQSPSMFKGTAYKAANWRKVGRTTGRGRDGGHHEAILPCKDIYIYPLTKRYLEKLRGPAKHGNPNVPG
jgi:hypothetical protein